MALKTSPRGIELIKKSEELRLRPYLCSRRKWTIGWGHVILPNEPYLFEGVTREEAEELLKKDLVIAENMINKAIQAPITQSEFDALVSFVFNIGIGNFNDSTLLRMIQNEKKIA